MFLMRNDTPQYKTLFPDLRGKLVYTQRENDISVLYTLDLQTEEARRVYSHDDPYNANILFPKWSEDASRIQFIAMHDKEWNVYSVRPDGTNLRLEGPAQNGNELLSRVSRTDDIVGKKGSLYHEHADGTQTCIYKHKYFDQKFNSGASEASWGMNKQYVIFELCTLLNPCSIYVADLHGHIAKVIGKAADPDWSL